MESNSYKSVMKEFEKCTFHSISSNSEAVASEKDEETECVSKPSGFELEESGNLASQEEKLCMRLLHASKVNERDFNLLKKVSSSVTNDSFIFCRALFLCNYASIKASEEEYNVIESIIAQYVNGENVRESKEITISSLPETMTFLAEDAMKKLEIEPSVIPNTDVFSLYCSAIHKIIKHFGNVNQEDMIFEWSSVHKNVPSIVWLLADLMDHLRMLLNIETQDVFSTKKVIIDFNKKAVSQFGKIEHCLTVLEQVFTNKRWISSILSFKNFKFMSSINAIFRLCLDNLLQSKFFTPLELSAEDNEIYKSGCICLSNSIFLFIKIFNSITTVTSDGSFNSKLGLHRFGTFLIQKLLICFFEFNRANYENKFNLQILCLEILLIIVNGKWISEKQFFEVMMMTTEVGNERDTSIHFMIKSLMASLDKIKTLEKNAVRVSTSDGGSQSFYSILNRAVPMEEVEEFGTAHFEANFITAYHIIIIGLFTDISQAPSSIFNYIPHAYGKACLDVLNKFQEFLILMNSSSPVGNFFLRSFKVFAAYL